MILIPSCAAYSDCWQPWLAFHLHHWSQGSDHRIVLATDYITHPRENAFDDVLDLSNLSMRHYPTPAWITRLRDALAFVKDKILILCCEDHWPLPSADWDSCAVAHNIIVRGTADCIRLSPCPGAPESQIGPFGHVPDGTPYRISCGPTLWNVARLRDFLDYLQHVLPLPTAHHYENFGSPASSRFGLNVWAVSEQHNCLPFLNSAVTGGKWNLLALTVAKQLGIDVDTSMRDTVCA